MKAGALAGGAGAGEVDVDEGTFGGGGGVGEDDVDDCGAETVIDGADTNTCFFSSSIYTKIYINHMIVIAFFIFFFLFLLSDRGELERELPA